MSSSSITKLNRTNRTPSTLLGLILFGRKTERIQFQFNWKDLPLVCIIEQFENKNISIDPELSKIVIVEVIQNR